MRIIKSFLTADDARWTTESNLVTVMQNHNPYTDEFADIHYLLDSGALVGSGESGTLFESGESGTPSKVGSSMMFI